MGISFLRFTTGVTGEGGQQILHPGGRRENKTGPLFPLKAGVAVYLTAYQLPIYLSLAGIICVHPGAQLDLLQRLRPVACHAQQLKQAVAAGGLCRVLADLLHLNAFRHGIIPQQRRQGSR